jgi:hypothetical protein
MTIFHVIKYQPHCPVTMEDLSLLPQDLLRKCDPLFQKAHKELIKGAATDEIVDFANRTYYNIVIKLLMEYQGPI